MAIYHLTIKSGSRAGESKGAGGKSRYLLRQGPYSVERKEIIEGATVRTVEVDKTHELVFSESGNMPEWADAPVKFWDASDRYERANGSTYREIEVALPGELTFEQQIALAKDFAATISNTKDGKTPYTLVIHQQDPSNPQNRHVHIILSDRINDGIARGPEQFFKRYNSKEPKKGGARKMEDRRAKPGQNWAHNMRPLWAQIANRHLEKAGLSVRIDHRSLEDQQAELEQRAEQAKDIDEKVDLLIAASRLGLKPIHKGKTTYHNPAKAKNRMAEIQDYEQYRKAIHRQRRADTVLSKRITNPESLLQQTQSRLRNEQLDRECQNEIFPSVRHPEKSKWRIYRERLLTQRYSPELAARLSRYVRVDVDLIDHSIKLSNKDIEVIDKGDRITAWSGNSREIDVMLQIAEAKGWKTLSFTGNPDFQLEIATEAYKRGFEIHDKQLLQRVLDAQEQAKAAERTAEQKEQKKGESVEKSPPSPTKAEPDRRPTEQPEVPLQQVEPTQPRPAPAQTPAPQLTAQQLEALNRLRATHRILATDGYTPLTKPRIWYERVYKPQIQACAGISVEIVDKYIKDGTEAGRQAREERLKRNSAPEPNPAPQQTKQEQPIPTPPASAKVEPERRPTAQPSRAELVKAKERRELNIWFAKQQRHDRRRPSEIRARWAERKKLRKERAAAEAAKAEELKYEQKRLQWEIETVEGERRLWHDCAQISNGKPHVPWDQWRDKTPEQIYGRGHGSWLRDAYYTRMSPSDGGLVIKGRDASIVDAGSIMLSKNKEDDIFLLLLLAEAKGWTELTITGPEQFVAEASRAALEKGFRLSGRTLESRIKAPEPQRPAPETQTEPTRKIIKRSDFIPPKRDRGLGR
ncbi:MobA/MobL family protein [Candidatus Igneacidithiobacillus taiwanensis]|uniref:MobA/MobL family protein n=1 Tax=Candidatus Igneacidithiobacillus taiwanensis TaxID=1945924 RepID=UPI0028A2B59A|nr:MobA/MobL family protein [Candidatus Igneacidithiobacillus taiwanensis]